jgi:hypothetical protein
MLIADAKTLLQEKKDVLLEYHNSVALSDDSKIASQMSLINGVEAKIELVMNMVRGYKQDD